MGLAGFKRQAQRLGVHIGEHQDAAARGIGDDGADQPSAVVSGRENASFFKLALAEPGGLRHERAPFPAVISR